MPRYRRGNFAGPCSECAATYTTERTTTGGIRHVTHEVRCPYWVPDRTKHRTPWETEQNTEHHDRPNAAPTVHVTSAPLTTVHEQLARSGDASMPTRQATETPSNDQREQSSQKEK